MPNSSLQIVAEHRMSREEIKNKSFQPTLWLSSAVEVMLGGAAKEKRGSGDGEIE